MKKALFITFEGVDGTGKSTQARLLKERLMQAKVPVVLTREPGGTRLAEKIRALLLNEEGLNFSTVAEILLYAAARAQHVDEVIRPALEDQKVVICERFTDSTLAYQGYASGNDLEQIRQIDQFASGGLVPDLTFLLDLTPQTGWARIQERMAQGQQDRIEARGSAFQAKVREGYLRIAAAEPERICVINSNGLRIDEVHRLIWETFYDKYHSLLGNCR
ncbi:MAG: dTMP kinase [Firmicutes bacterium]|nr:dTMP kinase [Bacillota bacterium]